VNSLVTTDLEHGIAVEGPFVRRAGAAMDEQSQCARIDRANDHTDALALDIDAITQDSADRLVR